MVRLFFQHGRSDLCVVGEKNRWLEIRSVPPETSTYIRYVFDSDLHGVA